LVRKKKWLLDCPNFLYKLVNEKIINDNEDEFVIDFENGGFESKELKLHKDCFTDFDYDKLTKIISYKKKNVWGGCRAHKSINIFEVLLVNRW
jgi:hypothetical protein